MKIFEPKAGLLDRIEQAFVIFTKNFFSFVLPYLLFQILFFVVLGTFFFYFIIAGVTGIFESDLVNFSNFFYSPKFIYFSVLVFIFFVIYLLLQIPLILGTIRSIRQGILEQKVTPKDNILWGFLHIFASFKTYWYIFAYVALIPAIIFIIGGIGFNIGFYYPELEILKIISIGIMTIGLVLFIIFLIYRGTRATFSLYLAIDREKFTKNNFEQSLSITNNNWWRIVGNFILIGLIIGLLQSLILGVFNSFIPDAINFSKFDYSGEITQNDLEQILAAYSPMIQIISGIIDQIIAVSISIFMFVFTYIFMMRLQDENEMNNDENLEINNLSADQNI